MRLDRVYVDGFRNLSNVEIDFNEDRLTTVIIGQNGAGKSNLIEAITDVFRYVDLNRGEPRYRYEIDYRIGSRSVRLTNLDGKSTILADGSIVSRRNFDREKRDLFPDLVFGYYSGGNRRLERLYDGHQRRYYDRIKTNDDESNCRDALSERRLFYCRQIHGVFALLSLFAFRHSPKADLLLKRLGIVGFHSALGHFKEPWFAKGGRSTKLSEAPQFWGAKGPAGACAKAFKKAAFCPLGLIGFPIQDYRDKQEREAQYACFLRNEEALRQLAATYGSDQEMFAALEAADISDLFRDLYVWVTRPNDDSGDVGFADLSDGERQLFMVLGLIYISRGKRALFLLDEPDTHLNPVWQHTYLDLIREWTSATSDATDCQFIITSHNPLTIAALEREEVRVMFAEESGQITVEPPYTDPRGLGFTATLTEVFGLPTSLDTATQKLIDERNVLSSLLTLTDAQEKRLLKLNERLERLGFMVEDREPLYQQVLHAWNDVRYADKHPLSPDQISKRHEAMKLLIRSLIHDQRE